MKLSCALLTLSMALVPLAPANGFETKRPEPERRLRIEIAPAAPDRDDFDRYVRELAAAARRDPEGGREASDKPKDPQAKTINPLTLLRW